MSDFLEQLFRTTKIKEFVPLFKEAEEKYGSQDEFLKEVTAYLPVRLYEHYYDDTVPHSFFGLIAASLLAQSPFPEDSRWRPLVQQSWFATKERKRTPLNIDDIEGKSEGDREQRWQHFQETADGGDFQAAMAWAKPFFKEEKDRQFFRRKSLTYALIDIFQGGHKFLYLFQAWRLAEALKWTHLDQIICPALHYLIVAPQDHSLSLIVLKQGRSDVLTSLLSNQGGITSESYDEAEAAFLFGDGPDESLQMLEKLADSGTSLESVQEVLLLAAAQALSNSRIGDWIWPMRAFHLAYCIRQWTDQTPDEKTFTLMIAAVVLNQASAKSRETDQNRRLDEVARQLCPLEPFNVLKSVISHTDPYASATAVYAILGMDDSKKEELFKTLSSQAVKNDGDMCYGHDILFIHEVVECYKDFQLAQKDRLPVAAGFFLGRVAKSYELFGTYKS
ncbi:MAG: hypothetical protein IH917_08865 [Acidobacteria bacterium]|nr:hypothetical protein [Acidobacteriota bacterium]